MAPSMLLCLGALLCLASASHPEGENVALVQKDLRVSQQDAARKVEQAVQLAEDAYRKHGAHIPSSVMNAFWDPMQDSGMEMDPQTGVMHFTGRGQGKGKGAGGAPQVDEEAEAAMSYMSARESVDTGDYTPDDLDEMMEVARQSAKEKLALEKEGQ
eukprot:gnl/TRDRNA2_/TRDRNA2_37717_c0_seq1.p1 gnl/TRDRNA2_/TRDRNA2_37717_c0~~gnl/TRDRNA2_/TRDRNA2_37717_c0_seq1.p1  ORF type:complete len:157 (-),score=37.52 gnl/TRDRNA2_/TRDRNA2_37717_c0_seq1:166-636(-)